ncbi:unnamed protein product, partial [Allacma fusca]
PGLVSRFLSDSWLKFSLLPPEVISSSLQYKKVLTAAVSGSFALGIAGFSNRCSGDEDWKSASSIYDFCYIDIDGRKQAMSKYRGCVLLFGKQEPGTNEDIKKFISQFNVKFDMASKVEVKGDAATPVFKYLLSQGGGINSVEWNFAKFLIDTKGQVYKSYEPDVEPFALEPDILILFKQSNL